MKNKYLKKITSNEPPIQEKEMEQEKMTINPKLMEAGPLWESDISIQDIKKDLEFTFCIGIFVEASSEYYGVIEMFNEAAVTGNRWKIKVISKEYIKNVVQDSIRSNTLKPFKQLCKKIIRHGGYNLEGKIPTQLLAYFIMYELRRLKNMYNQMKLHTVEVEEAKLDHLEQALQYDLLKLKRKDIFERTTSSITSAKVSINFHAQKKDEDTNSTEQAYGKRRPESELNTRYEERVMRFKEDFPLEGPQVYIAITTIYDPQLPTELIEVLGVPVNCVVKVGPPLKIPENLDKDMDNNETHQHILEEITNDYYRKKRNKRMPLNGKKLNLQKGMDIKHFWSGFINKIQQPEKTSFYASTTLAVYTPSLKKINIQNENWKDKLKKILYDEISFVLYNQSDLNLLYKKYMSSMKVTNLNPLGKCELENMEMYNAILQHIPNESLNIPIIFESIIAQISKLFGEDTEYDKILAKQENYRKDTPYQRQNNLLMNLKQLNLTHDILVIKNNSNDLKPRSILYGDFARLNSYHLGEFSKFISEKTFHLLSLQYRNLFQNLKTTDDQKNLYKRHMQIFRNAVGIRDRKKLSELLIILAIIDKNPFGPIYLCTDQKKWPDETKNIKCQYLIEDELNNINKNNTNNCHILMQNLNTIEEMCPEISIQNLHHLSIIHNTCETIYIPLLDGILFKFYNCPKNNYSTCVLQTPITLRDFIKYSLPEEKEWTNMALAEIQKSNIPETLQSDQEFHISLEEEEQLNPNDSRNSNLNVKEDIPVDEHKYKEIKQKQAVSMIYNVGPGQRLQFHSRKIEAMFRHGTKIRIHFQLQLYKEKIMNLELLMSGHRLYYSSSLTENNEPIKLLIQHRTGMILSFQQRECKKYAATFATIEKENELTDSYVTTKHDEKTSLPRDNNTENYKNINKNDCSSVDETEELERCQIKSSPHPFINRFSTYSFSASWPSGYFMECHTLPNDNTYIKQSYLTKGPSTKLINYETYRLNLGNNNVIKFMNNNTFEILFPTGKKITCFKYIWRKIIKQKKDIETGKIYEKKIKKITPIHYQIVNSDGHVVSMKNGEEVSEGNLDIRYHTDVLNDYKVSEMANGTTTVYKNDASQVVEFNDGTRFTTLVHVSKDEIFCDWNLEEKIKWFQEFSDFLFIGDILGDDPSSEEKINFSTQKAKLENEGYIYISLTVFVEHPNFATTYNCSETKTTVIRFPMSTSIHIYSNGTYDVTFANGTNISIKKDKFVIDKYLNNSLFQHTVIMPHALQFNDVPNPTLIHFFSCDSYGNELKIDTTNFIHYRYALSEQNRFCLKHLTDNVDYFFLRRNLSGMEIFPQCRLSNFKKITRESKSSYIQEFWNTPFKDIIFLSPAITASEKWTMPYSTTIASPTQNELSTYGKSWSFPYNAKQMSHIHTPKTLTIRIIKTFVCENIPMKLSELIEKYKNMINNNLSFQQCKCHKGRPWEDISYETEKDIPSLLYEQGNIIIKTPDESFMNYVREYIVLHAARVATKEIKKSKMIHGYNNQRTSMSKELKEIPPYFSSCFGIAYIATKEIRDKTNMAIIQKEYSAILDILLDKHINLINENDINDMTHLLKILKPELWKDGVSMKNVLSIGKQLQDNFNNMREVLKYHLSLKSKENTTEIYS